MDRVIVFVECRVICLVSASVPPPSSSPFSVGSESLIEEVSGGKIKGLNLNHLIMTSKVWLQPGLG